MLNVLVIEDDPTSVKLARLVLEHDGFRVTYVDAAEKAFVAIKQDMPNIILIDLVLPKMDGLAFVRRLREDPTTKNIPIVAITSSPERFTQEAALAAGCDSYVVKPLPTRELPEKIMKVLTMHMREIPKDGPYERPKNRK